MNAPSTKGVHARRPRFCVTELSAVTLTGAALAVSAVLWLAILLVQVQMHGLTAANQRRILCLSLFWHFLDLIWIGVFSFV